MTRDDADHYLPNYTYLSDLNILGICDILVYKMCHKVM